MGGCVKGGFGPGTPPSSAVWENDQYADSSRLNLSTRVGSDLLLGMEESGRDQPWAAETEP